MNNLTNLGGRKFILSMTVVLLSTVLVWFAKVDADVYKYLVLVTAGAYITGNVAQKATIGDNHVSPSKT